jgi:hypothetical protein
MPDTSFPIKLKKNEIYEVHLQSRLARSLPAVCPSEYTSFDPSYTYTIEVLSSELGFIKHTESPFVSAWVLKHIMKP